MYTDSNGPRRFGPYQKRVSKWNCKCASGQEDIRNEEGRSSGQR